MAGKHISETDTKSKLSSGALPQDFRPMRPIANHIPKLSSGALPHDLLLWVSDRPMRPLGHASKLVQAQHRLGVPAIRVTKQSCVAILVMVIARFEKFFFPFLPATRIRRLCLSQSSTTRQFFSPFILCRHPYFVKPLQLREALSLCTMADRLCRARRTL